MEATVETLQTSITTPVHVLLVTLGGTVESNLILVTVSHVNKVEHVLSLEVKISSVPVLQVSLQLPFELFVCQCN